MGRDGDAVRLKPEPAAPERSAGQVRERQGGRRLLQRGMALGLT